MPSKHRAILENSALYRSFRYLSAASDNSRVVRFLTNKWVLLGGAVAFVLVSVLRILLSGLHVGIKFMSFVAFAAVVVVLVWPYTEPLTNR